MHDKSVTEIEEGCKATPCNQSELIEPLGDATEQCYIVLMRRWGDIEGHTYIHGIYTDQSEAVRQGRQERDFRGDKYEYQVMSWRINTEFGQQVSTSIPGPYTSKVAERLFKRAKRAIEKCSE